MNYYDEFIKNIEQLIESNKFDEARDLIEDELKLPYVPKDFESTLKNYLSKIKEPINSFKSLSDENIELYLTLDEDHQLLAVNELDKRNLRDYIDICFNYLNTDRYINAKVLLIDSLIRQEINHTFIYKNNDSSISFNPSKLKPIEETTGYLTAQRYLNDTYMKEPSFLRMAMELLYKECLLYLPNEFNEDEGILISKKINKYIDEAFAK